MDNNICSNCSENIKGAYCHQCGQKKDRERITWLLLLRDLQNRLFGIDNKFVRTIKDLTLHPGRVIQSSIEGIHARYIGSVGYFFILITIYVLLTSILNIDVASYNLEMLNYSASLESDQNNKLQNEIFKIIYSNFRIYSFVMMPFFILGVWLIFKNKKYNYLESAVIVFYGHGHGMLLNIIGIIIYAIAGTAKGQILIAPISYIYFACACASFYEGNKIWNFIKGMFSLIIGFIVLALLSVILTVIYLTFNPLGNA